MIAFIISCFLIICFAEIPDMSLIDQEGFSQEISYGNTDCIEFCTDVCLNDENVYTCFDSCTMKQCNGDIILIDNSEVISGSVAKWSLGILFAGILGTLISFHKNLKNNDNYWPL